MRQIVIDTNLLVLLVVGLTDRALIAKHKRTKIFEPEDFDLLTRLLAAYDQIVITPHIVTEVSNLAAQIGEPVKSKILRTLATLLPTQQETFQPSIEIAQHGDFLRLGLTDCAILNLIQKTIPFVTVDLDLYLAAAKHNNFALNFNYLRAPRMLNA